MPEEDCWPVLVPDVWPPPELPMMQWLVHRGSRALGGESQSEQKREQKAAHLHRLDRIVGLLDAVDLDEFDGVWELKLIDYFNLAACNAN